jgi:phosphohistidine phosphatase SixA
LPHEVGDSGMGLSEFGMKQAAHAGQLIGHDFINESLVYCSSYRRTRETLNGILRSTNLFGQRKVYEDPRVRGRAWIQRTLVVSSFVFNNMASTKGVA